MTNTAELITATTSAAGADVRGWIAWAVLAGIGVSLVGVCAYYTLARSFSLTRAERFKQRIARVGEVLDPAARVIGSIVLISGVVYGLRAWLAASLSTAVVVVAAGGAVFGVLLLAMTAIGERRH